MIEIKHKRDCCGCHACASVCAHQAITMQTDSEGFLYPVVDKSTCTDCGLCEQVCPVIHQASPTRPLKVYAARSNDEELRRKSSSGGIFTLLAEAVIHEGGVVFGAKFDERWNVIHSWTDTLDGLADFRGSKYVQSTIGNTYKEAKEFLLQGRKVLFTGTPCQIAGLKRYLRKDYENLLAVDVICHGVPSPLVWQKYLDEMRTKGEITGISFRDKTNGWAQYAFRLNYIPTEGNGPTPNRAKEQTLLLPRSENAFMRGFLADLYLRPSCHACPARSGKSGSDITLGDFWGIQKVYPELNDNKGYSAILIRSEKGQAYYRDLKIVDTGSNYDCLLPENPSLEHSPKHTRYARRFWREFTQKGLACISPICKQKNNLNLKAQYIKIKRALLGLLRR